MKIGNQLYLEFSIQDDDGKPVDIKSVKKVQFNIDTLTKTFDGTGNEVSYDNVEGIFKVWITEEETFKFPNIVKADARVLFKNDTIMGTEIETYYWEDSLKEVVLDDEA